MRFAIRHPKDFWAGVIFTASGLGFGILSQDYEMGTATRMGPVPGPKVWRAAIRSVRIAAFRTARVSIAARGSLGMAALRTRS